MPSPLLAVFLVVLHWSGVNAVTTISTTSGEQCHVTDSGSNDMNTISSFTSTLLIEDDLGQSLTADLLWYTGSAANIAARVFLLSPSSATTTFNGGTIYFSSTPGITWLGTGSFVTGATLTVTIQSTSNSYGISEVQDDSCGSSCTCFTFSSTSTLNTNLPGATDCDYCSGNKVRILQSLQSDLTIDNDCSTYVSTPGNELQNSAWEIDVLFVYADLGTQRDQIPSKPWGWITAAQRILNNTDVDIRLNPKGFVRVSRLSRDRDDLRSNSVLKQWAKYYQADIVVAIFDEEYSLSYADQFNLATEQRISGTYSGDGNNKSFMLIRTRISASSYEFAFLLANNLGCANNLAEGPMFRDALGYTDCANGDYLWSTIMGDATCRIERDGVMVDEPISHIRRYSNKAQGTIDLWGDASLATGTVFNDCACAMRYSAEWVSKLSDAYNDVACPQFEIFTRNYEINGDYYAEIVSTTASRTNWWNSGHGIQFREYEGPSTLAVLSVDTFNIVRERLETCLDTDDPEGCIENDVAYWVGVEGEDGSPEEVAGLPEGEEGLINRSGVQSSDVTDEYYGTVNCDKADNPSAALGFFALGLNACNGKQQNNGGGCTGPYCGLVKTLVHFDNVCQRVAREISESGCGATLATACAMIADNNYANCPGGKPLQSNADFYEGKCAYEDITELCTCHGCENAASDVAAKRRHRLKALGKSHREARRMKGKGGKLLIQQVDDDVHTFTSGNECYEYVLPYPLGQNFFGQPLCPKMNVDMSSAWALFVPNTREEMDFVIDQILPEGSLGAWTGLTDLRIVGADASSWENRFSAITAIKPPIMRQFRRSGITGTGDSINGFTTIFPPRSDRNNALCPQNANCALVLDAATRELVAVDTTGGLYTILCKRECAGSA